MDIVGSVQSSIESFLFRESLRAGGAPWYKDFTIRFLRVLYIAVQKFRQDDIFMRAHALTFISALAIVPVMALIFSIAKGFGAADTVWEVLRDRLTGVQPEILDRIQAYVRDTNVGTLGTLGLLVVVYSAIKTVGSMEVNFNRIWNVPVQRSPFRKFTDYLSVIIIFPLLLLAATGLSASLRNIGLVSMLMETQYVGTVVHSLLSLGTYFTLWFACTFAYSFLPNTKVPILPALLGGVFAGTLWNVVQHLYITFQIGVAKYNAIYGTFASLPLFFMWIHISWLIILLGAEVAWVADGRANLSRLYGPRELSGVDIENFAVGVSLLLAERFQHGEPPFSCERIAEALDADEHHVNTILERLMAANVVSMVAGDVPAYQPARPLTNIRLGEVVTAVHGAPTSLSTRVDREWIERVNRIVREAREQSAGVLDRHTLQELVTGIDLCPCEESPPSTEEHNRNHG